MSSNFFENSMCLCACALEKKEKEKTMTKSGFDFIDSDKIWIFAQSTGTDYILNVRLN